MSYNADDTNDNQDNLEELPSLGKILATSVATTLVGYGLFFGTALVVYKIKERKAKKTQTED